MIHLLIDILWLEGYFFDSHFSPGVNGQWKTETIKSVWFENKIIYNKEEIENVGLKIHSYILMQIEMNKYHFEIGELFQQKV